MTYLSNWDYLIILDACRYDYFKKVYQDFLAGKLKKVLSPATRTEEWLKKTFRGYYEDIVYISANPIINSKFIVWDFCAKEHFYEIIDVWYWGWDEDYGTVPPWKVNQAVQKVVKKYSNKRLVIHYMQPHAPYIPIRCLLKFSSLKDPLTLVGVEDLKIDKNGESRVLKEVIITTFIDNLLSKVRNIIPKSIPRQRMLWELRKLLNQPSKSYEELIFRNLGISEIQVLYELNLRFALKYVAKLLQILPENRKIVVTADHAELLGERGEIGHTAGSLPHKYEMKLREVPWLEEVRSNMQGNRSWFDRKCFLKYAEFIKCFEKLQIKEKIKRTIEKR